MRYEMIGDLSVCIDALQETKVIELYGYLFDWLSLSTPVCR